MGQNVGHKKMIVVLTLKKNLLINPYYNGLGDMMKFKRLRDLREDHDLTQKEVAMHLCISQRYYSDLERGVGTLSAEHLKALCILYQVSADYILEFTSKK